MLKVGITGGIGSGKTTICKVFETLGVPVYYADWEAKQLLDNNSHVKEKVLTAFGKDLLNEKGCIERPKLASIVFNNKEKLAMLNSIVHPAVAEHFENWINEHQVFPYILKEAAIMFESGASKNMDKVITVVAPVDLRIYRTMKRDHVSEEQVLQRINNQMSDEEKIKRSDFVIYNDEDKMVIPQVLSINAQLLQV